MERRQRRAKRGKRSHTRAFESYATHRVRALTCTAHETRRRVKSRDDNALRAANISRALSAQTDLDARWDYGIGSRPVYELFSKGTTAQRQRVQGMDRCEGMIEIGEGHSLFPSAYFHKCTVCIFPPISPFHFVPTFCSFTTLTNAETIFCPSPFLSCEQK